MLKVILLLWACVLGLAVFVIAAIWIKEKFTSEDCVLREEVGDKFIEHFLEQDKTR